jgi:hypothetical protein
MLKDDLNIILFDNIWKQKWWQKIIPKTCVEQIKGNGKSYHFYIPLGT